MIIDSLTKEVSILEIAGQIAIALLTVAEQITLMIVEFIIFGWTWGRVAHKLLNWCVDEVSRDIDLVALVESFSVSVSVIRSNR